jgi:uncharacterized membrane protein YkoI
MNIATLLLCAALSHAAETKVNLAEVPPAAQKTIKEKMKGGKLKRIVKDTSKGAPTYEAELTFAGRAKDISVDENGSVIEIEEAVALSTLPKPAKAAIEKAAEGGRVKSVEAISRGGSVEVYEATIKKGRKKSEVRVDPTGKPVAD